MKKKKKKQFLPVSEMLGDVKTGSVCFSPHGDFWAMAGLVPEEQSEAAGDRLETVESP